MKKKKENKKLALKYYYQVLEFEDISNLKDYQFYVYRNLALLFIDLGELKEADDYIEKAFDVVDEWTQPCFYNELLSIKASVFKQKGENKLYQGLMEKVIANCSGRNLSYLARKLSQELAVHYYHAGKHKKSSQFFMDSLD